MSLKPRAAVCGRTVDVLQRRECAIVDAAPGTATAYELGLVQADQRLSGGVVAEVAFAAHRAHRASGVEAVGVADPTR
jgi:hypothetical protein